MADHRRRLTRVAVVLVGLGLLVASFLAGQTFSRPAWQRAAEQAQPIAVWADVDSAPVTDGVTLTGVVKPGSETPVTLPSGSSGVVVVAGVRTGRRLGAGQFLAQIAGRPYVAMPAPLPLYRDLARGDRGDDVRWLQRSLRELGVSVAVTGEVGATTLDAVERIFRRSGYSLPQRAAAPAVEQPATPAPQERPSQERFIPHQQLVPLTRSGVVTQALGVGDALPEDGKLAVVRGSSPHVEATADVVQARALRVGQPVTVEGEKGQATGSIRTIGDFRPATDTQAAGRLIDVDFATGDSTPRDGEAVRVRLRGDSSSTRTRVPLTAIRQAGSRTWVIVQTNRGEREADVVVDMSAEGFAAVTGDVRPGDKVKVS